ncbi:alanine dehydrogenase [Mariprofundus micogutta]|uniref:Alanine dehydrogenase n=1 Tax=Mariprofundus micogutta TaxID=1921010 RepID=A0A1L8CLS4_9PROT|nr:alanine dehydrogenase [Mariprofundus micogutta]GAV19853.1 alanine dehydrogenase [Mariprofundus micogutta]
MRIGIPKEIKNHEHRVALSPAGAAVLIAAGHQVVVQSEAGLDSGYSDDSYLRAGAEIVTDAWQAWGQELVVKVKEPQQIEYEYLRGDLILFTFLHLAAFPELAGVLRDKKTCAIAYETVQTDAGLLPLLKPMSEVAGRVAVQLGASFLQKENGTAFPGKGCLPCAIGTAPAMHAVILGAGNVGMNAADAAAGLGARVTLLERDEKRIKQLQRETHKNITVMHFSHDCFYSLLPDCDLLIGATLIPGKHAPELLGRSDLRQMQNGSVFIDVSIDQGGISETCRATSYDEPVYVEEGVIHCCLPNLPAAVPQTSTRALTEITLPYIQSVADLGVDGVIKSHPALQRGINTLAGEIIHPAVAASLSNKVIR